MNDDSSINQSVVYGIKGVPSVNNKPGKRETAFTWTDKAGNLWLFGGTTIGGVYDDMWRYNPSTKEWTWMKGSTAQNVSSWVYGVQGVPAPGNWPGARRLGVSWTDTSGNFWLFGGIGGVRFNDLWKYNPLSNQWAWMKGDSANSSNPNGNYGNYGIQGLASSQSSKKCSRQSL